MLRLGIHQIRAVALELLQKTPSGLAKQVLINQIAVMHPATELGTISTQLNSLVGLGLVDRPRRGFYVANLSRSGPTISVESIRQMTSPSPAVTTMSAREFEDLASEVMSRHYGTRLRKVLAGEMIKRFDFVSEDGTIVGDAKCFSLVGGERLPSAKFSIIAEHVWLLEKTPSKCRFLVFGNQREVPEQWLARYGQIVSGVDFYFIGEAGKISKLYPDPTPAGRSG